MKLAGVVVALTLLGACATTGDPPGTSAPRATEPSASGELPLCDELEWFHGPEELYRDRPAYVGNEMPIEQVLAFAEDMGGFVNVWIDRERNGWVNVGFVGVDLASAQAELDAAFPGEGVVAVELPYTERQLLDRMRLVGGLLPEGMHPSGYNFVHGHVQVWVGELTEERVAAVAAVAEGTPPVCVEGHEPGSLPAPGPQPEGDPDGHSWSRWTAVPDRCSWSETPTGWKLCGPPSASPNPSPTSTSSRG